MAVREYIGARYVPRFMGLYNATQIYDALDVVDNGLGTSYIAKKTVPAGTALTDTDYWFVYGASSGAIIDLQNRMTTAEGNIGDLQGDVSALGLRMTAAEGKITTNYNQRRKRNFIIIGDSFGAGVVAAGQPLVTGWIQAFKQMWQDNGHGNVYYNVIPFPGVSGFASSLPFLQILTDDIETQISDFNEITDIVVLGGTNDISESYADVTAAVRTFCLHCKDHFPYARLAIGVYGSNKNGLINSSVPAYRTCISYGAEYIDDLFNLICDPQYISDGTHLTEAGYNFYNPYVCQAILYGHCDYRFYLGFLPTSSAAPMLRFIVTEKNINVAITKYNSANMFNDAMASIPDSFTLATYDTLPKVNLKNDTYFAMGELFYKDPNYQNIYQAGKFSLKLDLSTKELICKSTPFPQGTTPQARYIAVNNDWHNISDIDYV